jgi:hypothetical protein
MGRGSGAVWAGRCKAAGAGRAIPVCSGGHHWPRDKEGTHPGRVSHVRNVETPAGVQGGKVAASGRPTVRKADIPSGTGWSKKRMPVAERQQETGRNAAAFNGLPHNWPDTGDVCPARKGADVDQVSL